MSVFRRDGAQGVGGAIHRPMLSNVVKELIDLVEEFALLSDIEGANFLELYT